MRLSARARCHAAQSGLTLVELIVFIVVVGVGLAGVLVVLNATVKSSADPLVRKQALAVAEAMLDEIMSKSYENDPNDSANTSATLGCTANTNPTCRQNTPADRARYNDVDDYNGWNQNGVFDLSGNPVSGLGRYTVTVGVALLNNFNGVVGKQTTVTVSAGAESVAIAGFRGNF